MTHDFDKDYWQAHWSQRPAGDDERSIPPHPHLERELAGLRPGTALDAGCGEGAEAIWLASRAWQVTAADISREALARAAEHEARGGAHTHIEWVEADLSVWEPGRRFDLVTSHYAHAAIPQLELYDRLAGWVAPGGTLLLVGHLHAQHGERHHHEDREGQPPPEATVTAATITDRLAAPVWDVVTADELARTMTGPGGRPVELHDVVVRATRR
jgi:SAM-dependent methyltransferase